MNRRRLIAGTINRYPPEDGWENWHLDASARGIWDPVLERPVKPEFVMDIAEMPEMADSMWHEIRAHHVLEHLPGERGRAALAEFFRILIRGGVLDIEVPDMDRIAAAWVDGWEHTQVELQQWIYGEEFNTVDPHLDNHRHAYGEQSLRVALEEAGFKVGEREETGLALRFRAVKP